jgi:hypothetical protein
MRSLLFGGGSTTESQRERDGLLFGICLPSRKQNYINVARERKWKKINIHKMQIDEIKPYERNAKKHPKEQLKHLADIVREIGWRQPVEVNQDGVIVVGHGRFMAWKTYAKAMGLPDIWVIDDTGKTIFGEHDTRKLTKEQEKMWRIADNKVNETGWELGLVQADFDELERGLKDLTGFKDGDFKKEDEIIGEIDFTTEILEENNYIVFVFDKSMDFMAVSERFGLKTKDSLDSRSGYRRSGIGRVVDGNKLLELL